MLIIQATPAQLKVRLALDELRRATEEEHTEISALQTQLAKIQADALSWRKKYQASIFKKEVVVLKKEVSYHYNDHLMQFTTVYTSG